MRCQSCGHENPADADFCEECAGELVRACAGCGTTNTPTAKFCKRCRAALTTTSAAAAAETKQPDPAPALPSSFASGRYQVRRFLGEGGRKRVYLAQDAKLSRDVAVSILKTEGLDASGVVRVNREAQAMGQLGDTPHIVTIYDTGEENGQPYLVSQYMAGGSVEDLMNAAPDRRLPLERTLEIGRAVCAALQHAHGHGIIHRDLKPGNIWLSAEGSAAIGDFGLAKALDRSRLTLAGSMVGTVAYMPPEQALGGEVTPRSDLYSLGAMLYELVTGRPPFLGDDPTAVISQHINTAAVAPSWLTEHCPPDLEELILRLLEKDPSARPESAALVLETLERVDPAQRSASHSESNVLDRLARGVFVGRERELERLHKAFDEAFAGRGTMLMLVGEPGIGKTRTAQELETYARLRGGQVLWGRAHEGAGAPAYWPWMQIGNQYATSNDVGELATDMQGKGSQLAPMFPWLREQANFIEPEPLADAEAQQFRLFDAYATFVRAIANRGPLLVALDDLHWADKPSLLLLQHLARELSRMRVLVVATYRDTDLVRTHPLSEALATLNRESGFQRVVMRGLSRAEVADYIRAAANVTPRPELLDRIFEETEGNPFFLSEVVNLLTQEGKLTESVSDIAVPDGVREALGRRLDRISEEANELLQVAAVAGREFNYDTLTLLGQGNEDTLLRLIEEALEARVIEEMKQTGRYRFTHALMQETLLDELSTTRRVRIHGQVAEALEERWGTRADERAPRLAGHFVEAAMLSLRHAAKAVRYSKLAAQQAETQFAWDVAAQHYEHCLTLISEADDKLGENEAELLFTLGRCARDDGNYRASWRSLMRAITLYRQQDEARGMARATLEALLVPAPPQRWPPLIQAALTALGDQDPYLEALLLSHLMYPENASQIEAAEAERAQQRLDDLVSSHDFADVEAQLLRSDEQRAWDNGDLERSAKLSQEIHERFAKLGQARNAAAALFSQAYTVLSSGRLDAGSQLAAESAAYARAHHIRFYDENSVVLHAAVLLARCDWPAFDALAEERASDASYIIPLLRASRAEMAGDPDGAVGPLPDPGLAGGRPIDLAILHAVRARIFANAGQHERAQHEFLRLREAMAGSPRATPIDGVAILTPGLVPLDEAAVALGDDAFMNAAGQYIQTDAYATAVAYDPFSGRCGLRVFAAIALARDHIDDAERRFRTALEWCERERCPAEAARCLQGLAEVAQRRGDLAQALQLLDRAAGAYREHGATFYLRRALALKLEWQGVPSADIRTSIEAVTIAVERERPDVSAHAAPDGKVTLMFSDIEDSTPLAERLGDEAWVALLREHNAIFREQIAAHEGYEVKTIGDAFMVAFESAEKALRCAVAIQSAFLAYNHDHARQPLHVRIGLHTGEAIRDAGDFYGTNVILASRIVNEAKGGEILVSSTFRQLVEAEAEFGAVREVALKGLSGTHHVQTVEWNSRAM